MCGIVGYIGDKSAVSVLMVGLAKLEYRGYDSAGVAILNGDVHLRRAVGKLRHLEASLHDEPIDGATGIAHTRWATHGEPSETNSHPHRDASGSVFVVHNGIVENYAELRAELEAKGVEFRSQTDTEVLPNLIKEAYDALGDTPHDERLPKAVRTALAGVRGAYSLGVLHKDHPGQIIGVRLKSPLVVGLGEGENFLASDMAAILNATRRVMFLDDGEMAILTREKVEVCDLDDGKMRNKSVEKIDWSPEQAEKGGYAHFMLKEIHEQPDVINRLVARYTNPERTRVHLDQIGLSDDELRGIRRIFIQACGTSWHAGLVGKMLLERLPNMAVDVDISSEFRYRNAILTDDTLVLAISQSGETEDTKAGIEEARSRGLKVLSIVNVPGSSIVRMSDGVIYTNAGPEISVASTKAYTAQLGALYLLSLHLGQLHGLIDPARMVRRLEKLTEIANAMARAIEDDEPIKRAAEAMYQNNSAIFIGRGLGFPTALEGALKLKEISYIHAEGYPAGELKHGPLALVNENMPVVAIATDGAVYEKIRSNIQEVRARKGRIIAVVSESNNDPELVGIAEHVLRVPELTESYAPFLTVLPLQLLAYHIAKLRGCDIDQPRNLAKSVTVE
ncbi:MAG TPA: glutamine--fructose-6-phosphate transaminase (isomerizing) [Abditibacteriaceae bacterium]|jgi:glucosamine--fructose-6-phosphate aminotransferase (isomerizing)